MVRGHLTLNVEFIAMQRLTDPAIAMRCGFSDYEGDWLSGAAAAERPSSFPFPPDNGKDPLGQPSGSVDPGKDRSQCANGE
jgi:hypothetical protein